MRYADIIETLLSRLPEISEKYNEEGDYIEGLPHLVFAIVFVPYFMEIMDGTNQSTKVKAIELLEEMITCEDEEIKELVVVSVLESLLPERDFLMRIRYQLGLKTQERLQVLEKGYGWI